VDEEALRASRAAPDAHAMRNELVEELNVEGERTRQQRGRSETRTRKEGMRLPLGEASLSEKKDAIGCQDRVRPSPTRARRQRLLGCRITGS